MHLQGSGEQKSAPAQRMPVEKHKSVDASPSFSLNGTPTVRESSVPVQTPSVGASSEEQQHFKWNGRCSRHTVIHFSSASALRQERGQARLQLCVCVCGGDS